MVGCPHILYEWYLLSHFFDVSQVGMPGSSRVQEQTQGLRVAWRSRRSLWLILRIHLGMETLMVQRLMPQSGLHWRKRDYTRSNWGRISDLVAIDLQPLEQFISPPIIDPWRGSRCKIRRDDWKSCQYVPGWKKCLFRVANGDAAANCMVSSQYVLYEKYEIQKSVQIYLSLVSVLGSGAWCTSERHDSQKHICTHDRRCQKQM